MAVEGGLVVRTQPDPAVGEGARQRPVAAWRWIFELSRFKMARPGSDSGLTAGIRGSGEFSFQYGSRRAAACPRSDASHRGWHGLAPLPSPLIVVGWSDWLPRRHRTSTAAEIVGTPEFAHMGLKLDHGADIGDCEAFMTGHLAEYREAHNQYVASWEWTNLLAHGSEDDLRDELAADHRRGRHDEDTPNGRWRVGRADLASRLLSMADSRRPLNETQRLVLIPLELELAANDHAARWRPQQWVAVVESVLKGRRAALPRSARQAPRPVRHGTQRDGSRGRLNTDR